MEILEYKKQILVGDKAQHFFTIVTKNKHIHYDNNFFVEIKDRANIEKAIGKQFIGNQIVCNGSPKVNALVKQLLDYIKQNHKDEYVYTKKCVATFFNADLAIMRTDYLLKIVNVSGKESSITRVHANQPLINLFKRFSIDGKVMKKEDNPEAFDFISEQVKGQYYAQLNYFIDKMGYNALSKIKDV